MECQRHQKLMDLIKALTVFVGDVDQYIESEKHAAFIIPEYRDIVLSYVRAIRIRENRPSNLVRKFAKQLASLQFQARHLIRLHLNVLNEFSRRALPAEDRAFSNDARLVLVELLGNLIDIYLNIHKVKCIKKVK